MVSPFRSVSGSIVRIAKTTINCMFGGLKPVFNFNFLFLTKRFKNYMQEVIVVIETQRAAMPAALD
ncbi:MULTISPECIES: hypothetical protein [Agrobacterium]|uniref:Uncharacterized protein n=1 Tax=Agrobacterium tumefaciens TaxID=358 RepID=A0AAE6EG90_AGRTU|nr:MULTISPECIES: hypothetical protein [Agrobacterium]QCL75562.1 hypothetical protein CFBP5499_18905 [Agrobacterium tumefaciens]QCL81124.1 hypothetical protein CFBP5877_18445 [Agrobacterium tumefaciens]CUX58059.1 conserved hypothetical protein [Agrobacterium sp. NCPPB 925]